MFKTGLRNMADGLAAAKKGTTKQDYWLGASWGAVWSDTVIAQGGEFSRLAADEVGGGLTSCNSFDPRLEWRVWFQMVEKKYIKNEFQT